MTILTKRYIDEHEGDFRMIEEEDELLSILYFYWLRNAAESNNWWCRRSDSFIFSEAFATEMKKRLQFIFHRVYADGYYENYHHFLRKRAAL
jgi:hypothetical protein